MCTSLGNDWTRSNLQGEHVERRGHGPLAAGLLVRVESGERLVRPVLHLSEGQFSHILPVNSSDPANPQKGLESYSSLLRPRFCLPI